MWKNVIGQERVKEAFKSSLGHKMIAGAYLFYGPEGVGKDAAAFELAKVLNCLDLRENGTEACDECANCLLIDALQSPVILFLHALPSEAATSEKKDDVIDVIREEHANKSANKYYNIEIPGALTIHIASIRELRLELSRSLSGGRRRVVIISEADTMNAQAQNALLKTLEEPHPDTVLILTSSNPHRLFPTIHSRAQDVRFELLREEDIAIALEDRDELAHDQAVFLARLASGSYARARAMIGEDLMEMRQEVVDFMLSALSTSRQKAVQSIDKFLPRSGGKFLEKRVAVEQRLMLIAMWLRDALAIATDSHERIINVDQLEYLNRFTARFGNPRKIIRAIRAVETAHSEARMQLQLRPVMLSLVMELESALL